MSATDIKENATELTTLIAEKKELAARTKEINAQIKEMTPPIVDFMVEKDKTVLSLTIVDPAGGDDTKAVFNLKRKAAAKKTVNKAFIAEALGPLLEKWAQDQIVRPDVDTRELTDAAADHVWTCRDIDDTEIPASYSLTLAPPPKKAKVSDQELELELEGEGEGEGEGAAGSE